MERYGPALFYTGHSRGGAEAKIAQATHGGGQAIVFNSAPTATGVVADVVEYRMTGDAISLLQVFKATTYGDFDFAQLLTRGPFYAGEQHGLGHFATQPRKPPIVQEPIELQELAPTPFIDPQTRLEQERVDELRRTYKNLPDDFKTLKTNQDIIRLVRLERLGIPMSVIRSIIDDRIQSLEVGAPYEELPKLPTASFRSVALYVEENMVDVTFADEQLLGLNDLNRDTPYFWTITSEPTAYTT